MISSMASSSSSSSSSATVRVDKATSKFLIGPDWTLNMEICDVLNSNKMLAKDVVKAVKKRLQHKNPKVQLLALTLLETLVNNCGDYVHFQIADKNILQEMVKIVKKKIDMHVRDKVLTLIGSWHEAFGGSAGRYPQYHMAYDDLRRFGVQFPRAAPDAAPISSPAATHSVPRPLQLGYGMPSSSTRLDEAMEAEDNLSLSSLNSMRNVLELLTDMLQAVDLGNPSSVKDEIILDLVEQCRVNQRKLMQTLGTTGDEEFLFLGLNVNDNLQSVIAKHDAIASGFPLPPELTPPSHLASEKHESRLRSPEDVPPSATSEKTLPAPVIPAHAGVDDEDDDFAQLARRHSKLQTNVSPFGGCNALVPVDRPASVEAKEDQNIIELLSMVLSTDASTEQTPQASSFPVNHPPYHPPSAETYPSSNGIAFNNYVAPWAQQPQYQYTTQPSPSLNQPPQNIQNAYPPPPWAATPGYFTGNENSMSRPMYTYSTPRATSSNSGQSGQYDYTNGEVSRAGQKPYVLPYRLFEELDVFCNGRYRPGSNGSAGSSNQNMVGGRKCTR